MKNTPSHVLTAVDWSQLCPWLILKKCLRVAFSVRLTVLTLLIILFILPFWGMALRDSQENFLWHSFILMGKISDCDALENATVPHSRFLKSLGWGPIETHGENHDALAVLHMMNSPVQTDEQKSENDWNLESEQKNQRKFFWMARKGQIRLIQNENRYYSEDGRFSSSHEILPGVSCSEIKPVKISRTAVIIVVSLTCFVGGFLFLATSRFTAEYLASGVRTSVILSGFYALQRFRSVLGAILFWLIGILITSAPIWLASFFPSGLLMLWPILMLFAMLTTVLGFAFLFGFPFLFTSVACDRADCYDALSRSFSYATQRPLRYGFYILVAAFFGFFGRLFVSLFALGVIYVMFYVSGINACDTDSYIWFWCYLIGMLPTVFLILYAFSAATCIYLLLRRDVDSVELHEIWSVSPQGVPIPKLPTLNADAVRK